MTDDAQATLTGYAWYMQLGPTLEDQYQDFLAGPLALLEQKLSASPQTEWAQIVQSIDAQFGIPINLTSQKAIGNNPRLSQQQRIRLEAGEMVMLSQHPTEAEYIYYRLKESDYYLEVGKLQIPFMLRNANLIILSLLATLLAFAIWLWLRPMWQDLRQLKLASEGFGQGQLTTRIPVSRFSFIKTILLAFNTMAGRIEQLITSHKTLTNAVSHELRTPVSRLRFSLAMLEKTQQSEVQQRLIKMADDIMEYLGVELHKSQLDIVREFAPKFHALGEAHIAAQARWQTQLENLLQQHQQVDFPQRFAKHMQLDNEHYLLSQREPGLVKANREQAILMIQAINASLDEAQRKVLAENLISIGKTFEKMVSG